MWNVTNGWFDSVCQTGIIWQNIQRYINVKYLTIYGCCCQQIIILLRIETLNNCNVNLLCTVLQ